MVLGAVLLYAAYTKLIDPASFAELIRAEGLDGLVPASVVAFVALALEIGLGLLLLMGVRRWWNLAPTMLLVGFFLFLTGRAYLLSEWGQVDAAKTCGCFGHLIERTPAQAFWTDLALLLPALVLAFVAKDPVLSPGVMERPGFPAIRTGIAVTLTAGALVFAHFAPGLPLDDLATRLKPGLSVDEVCVGEEASRICLHDAIPLLTEGSHVIVIADLEDPAFVAKVPELNQYALEGKDPQLWVMTSAAQQVQQRFGLLHGATFHIQEAPAKLLRPLYRRLPRTFFVVNGVVTRTFDGIPPLQGAGEAPPG